MAVADVAAATQQSRMQRLVKMLALGGGAGAAAGPAAGQAGAASSTGGGTAGRLASLGAAFAQRAAALKPRERLQAMIQVRWQAGRRWCRR